MSSQNNPSINRPSNAPLTYLDSGVNRDEGDRLVSQIQKMTQKLNLATKHIKLRSTIGGYASLIELDSKRWLSASTDGVGTKLKLAFRLNEHQTIGIDLVAMSVNDLLCVGSLPLFFLDYFATSKLKQEIAQSVLLGIVEGCKQARCALVGGETAEMPGLYQEGEYDLAGFAVGMLHPKQVLPKKTIQKGDVLIALASSGFHSNGFSLLRKWIPSGLEGDALAKELLTPTRIYVDALGPLITEPNLVKGLAHITGSGLLNIPRLSENVSYVVELPKLKELPRVFTWVREKGLPLKELTSTFNCGLGMVIVVEPKKVDLVLKKLKKQKVWVVGEVTKKTKTSQVFVKDLETQQTAVLE